MGVTFRFQTLDIWGYSIELSDKMFDIADKMEEKHLYRFADQIRGVGLSIPNNIAEGSGCDSKKEFARFLGISRRSAFEGANIVIILARRRHLREDERDTLLEHFDHLCRMLSNFQKSLR